MKNKELVIVINQQLATFINQFSKLYGSKIYTYSPTKYENDNSAVDINNIPKASKYLVIDSSFAPVNDNLMGLFLINNALKINHNPSSIINIVMHFPYARSDFYEINSAFALPLICSFLKLSGASEICGIDLHTIATTGFSQIPFYNLSPIELIANYILKNYNLNNFSIVSPDFGGAKRVEELAQLLNVEIVILRKSRVKNKIYFRDIVGGDIKNKHLLVYDEEVITGSSKINIANHLKEIGALTVHGFFSHSDIQSKQDYLNLLYSPYDSIILTDSTPVFSNISRWGYNSDKVKLLSLSSIIFNYIEKKY
jgi:ribose-phosphate pyrophosphokinase